MKRLSFILISILLLSLVLSLAGCGRAKVSEPYYTDSPASSDTASDTASDEAPAETAPPLSEGAQTDSRIAGCFMADDDGTLYTTLAEAPEDAGIVYLYDVLPSDIGYIYVFIPSGGIIYAVVRADMLALDVAGLYAYDLADGTAELLADDCSGMCKPILAGNMLYYTDNEGNGRQLDLDTGDIETVLTDVDSLFAAEGGFLYYSRPDGGVYRNDSTMSAEYQILDSYNSLQLFASDSGLCSVGYGSDTSVPILQFRDTSGNLLCEQALAGGTSAICQQGDTVFAIQPGEDTLVSYSISDGSLLNTVDFPDAGQALTLLYVTDSTVYYLRMDGSTPTLASAELSSGASTELGAALAF